MLRNAATLRSGIQSGDLLWIPNLVCRARGLSLCSGRDFVEVVQDPKAGLQDVADVADVAFLTALLFGFPGLCAG